MNVRWSQEELDLTGLSVLPFPSPPGPGWRRFSVGGVVADRSGNQWTVTGILNFSGGRYCGQLTFQ